MIGMAYINLLFHKCFTHFGRLSDSMTKIPKKIKNKNYSIWAKPIFCKQEIVDSLEF